MVPTCPCVRAFHPPVNLRTGAQIFMKLITSIIAPHTESPLYYLISFMKNATIPAVQIQKWELK
jgi:hypothetical protein